MNSTINSVVTVLGWVLFLLTLVASYFEYAKKHDPEVADKIKHVGTFAEWAVSLQDTLDKSNAEKLQSATSEMLKQAEKSGIKLTDDMAKGAVEKAVSERKPASKATTPAVDGKAVAEKIAELTQKHSQTLTDASDFESKLDDLQVHDLKDDNDD